MLALPRIRFLSNKQCVKSGKRDLVKFNDPFLVLVQVALLIVFVSIKWTLKRSYYTVSHKAQKINIYTQLLFLFQKFLKLRSLKQCFVPFIFFAKVA